VVQHTQKHFLNHSTSPQGNKESLKEISLNSSIQSARLKDPEFLLISAIVPVFGRAMMSIRQIRTPLTRVLKRNFAASSEVQV
jgi:hypothetical protein